MPEVIIADTSCLIVLTNAGQLDVLRLVYGKVAITPEIAGEYGATLPDWLIVKAVQDRSRVKLLSLQIDQGEASALALATELPHSTVILDDLKARKLASRLSIRYTGTLGVVVKAKVQGHLPSIQPLLARLRTVGFRISPELEAAALKLAGELPAKD